MIEDLKKTLESLKKRIRFNLDRIHENEEQVKNILKEPVSDKRSEKLNIHFNHNKRMIKENNDALKIQKEIIQYLENYRSDIVKSRQFSNSELDAHLEVLNSGNTKIKISREDYFQLTIDKEIDFDTRHPYYQDKDFLEHLIEYFISIEDYEMCGHLTEISKSQLII